VSRLRPLRRAAAILAIVVALAGADAPFARAGPPPVTAPQAILIESGSGQVLFARNPDARRPVASATKLMTALVVLERVSLDTWFVAPGYQPISPAETRLGLVAGERMRVRDLLGALLLGSANDAAAALAVGTAGSSEVFVELMNRSARRLGLRNTSFANPIGLDDSANFSSAADLARLTARLRANPFFVRTVGLQALRLRSGRRARVVDNRNDLVGSQPFVDGVKTGHTLAAGYVLVGSATRGPVSVISAVLGDPSESAREADTAALLRYGLSQLRSVRVLTARRAVGSRPVRHRESQRVGLSPVRSVTRVVRSGQRTTVRVLAPITLEGPLPAGARVGSAVVSVGGRAVARVPVVTTAAVPSASVLERVIGVPLVVGTLVLATLTLAGAAVLTRGRRRRDRASPRRSRL
jgi:serine-type D-Ala-D-Ala carboxypeptidase (penicillin-binding protein 5/6)